MKGENMNRLRLDKLTAPIRLSDEALFYAISIDDARFDRRANVTKEPPTPEAWDRYRAARAGLEALQTYEGTEWGGPDYATEVPEPEPTTTIDYLETLEEWLARCRALLEELTAAGEAPTVWTVAGYLGGKR